jgi:hypothetical protein
MATVTRKWYAYNCIYGGQFDHTNYLYVGGFPSNCIAPANNICAVLGIHEVSGSANPSENQVHGTHPLSFLQDSRLSSYIQEALANTDYAPRGAGIKPYVYKRNCF